MRLKNSLKTVKQMQKDKKIKQINKLTDKCKVQKEGQRIKDQTAIIKKQKNKKIYQL